MVYEYNPEEVPSSYDDYDSSETTTEQDLKKLIDLQQIEIDHLNYLINKNNDDHIEKLEKQDLLLKELELFNSNFEILLQNNEESEGIKLTTNEELIASIGNIEKSLESQADTNAVINTWGTIYVPLILIVVMLWWFFRQFLERYF